METINWAQKASFREQILASVVVFGLLIIFFRVVLFPLQAERQQIQSRLNNLQLERAALEKFTHVLVTEFSNRPQKPMERESQSKVWILKGEQPSSFEEVAPLLKEITQPYFLKGTRVKKISDIPSKQVGNYRGTEFFLNVHGSFQNTIAYLNRIQEIRALLTIDQVSLKITDSQSATVDMEINGTLFVKEKT